MADQAPNFTAPGDFHALDKRVAAKGAPQTPWLGQELVLRGRWLAQHCRHGFAVPLFDAEVAEINGGLVGPHVAYGTGGARTAEWYLYATIAYGATARIVPAVVEPAILPPQRAYERWGLEATGTGNPELYGPLRAPHIQGPSLVALVIYPEPGAGAATEGGGVYDAGDEEIWVEVADLGSVARSWIVRLLDGATILSDWMQVLEVLDRSATYSSLRITPPFPAGVGWRSAAKIQWEAKAVDGAVTCHCAGWREVAE